MIQIFGNTPDKTSCMTLITFSLAVHIHLLLISDHHSNLFPTLSNRLCSTKFTEIGVKGSKKIKPLWQNFLSRMQRKVSLCIASVYFLNWWMEEIMCTLGEVLHHQRLPWNVSIFFLLLIYAIQKHYQAILHWTAYY